jgi:hypothetical protein
MALKYWFEYNDLEDVTFRCEIESDSFVGSSTEITGYCLLEYAEVEDHFTPIRGSGLTMILDASIDLPFDDLSTENERVYKVTLQRDSQIIFVGFINPEGIFEDWVNDRWTMDVSVVGGLGFLENLSYVNDSGLPFIGQQSPIEIISNCLKRTGLELKINTNVDFEYVGFVSSDAFGAINILTELRLLTERFIRDDEDTIMDCKEVLESVLNLFNACICQMDGEWWIFKAFPILKATDGATFFEYTYEGVPTLRKVRSISTRVNIGSQINGATIFHCNANQRKERRSSLAAFKVNYKYGLVDSIFVNDKMELDGALGAVGSIEGWSYLNASEMTYQSVAGTSYIGFDSFRGADEIYAGDTPVSCIITEDIPTTQGTFLSFEFETIHEFSINAFAVRILLDIGTDVYYLNVNDGWISTSGVGVLNQTIFLEGPRTNSPDPTYNTFEVKTPAMLDDGNITVIIMQPRVYLPFSANAFIKGFKVFPSQDNNINGEFHTVQRTNSPSSRVPDVLEVYNGDNPNDNIYEGTIYKEDGETQTEFWKRDFITESKPLLRLVAEERLRLYQGVQTLFSGDIFGYIPYLSKILISSVDGAFMPIYYSYDTKNNITTLTNLQGYTDEVVDIDYEFEIDYGNTVKPTIKG